MVALIIPVRNGGAVFREALAAIAAQDCRPETLLVMDSASRDDSVALARAAGFKVEPVPEGAFDHGGTRTRAVNLVSDEIVVMLTQDAILDRPDALSRLLASFDDPRVGAAYGRQVPHYNADPLATHARLTNYGPAGYVTDLAAPSPRGIRKAFLSNSFAAYRRAALLEVGNFPSKLILGEDVVCSGRLLKAGYKIAYAAEAAARHSHNYSLAEEFRRYFDIGVFHREQDWLLQDFGAAEGEGARFALGQIGWLWQQRQARAIPRSLASSALKFVGYKLGRQHRGLGPALSRRLAMHKGYFTPAGRGH